MLRRTLESIGSAVNGDAIEILVVDNGSDDETRVVYKRIEERFPQLSWRYFYEPVPGLLSGRHRGVEEARGEILTFLDDDVLLAPGWLEALENAFADPKVALAGGPSRPRYEIAPPHWLDGLWSECEGGRYCSSLSLIELGSSPTQVDPLLVFGLNFSIRKSALEQGGGFHPDCIPKALQRYQGDGETGLSLKIREQGLLAIHHPNLAVAHLISASRLTPEYFEQRAIYQGVCDSYTQIRESGKVPTLNRPSFKDFIRSAKWKIERQLLLLNPTIEGVRLLMARAHFEGMQFHQDEVRNDPKLLEWVLRPNYFNYSLPVGWERYSVSDAERPTAAGSRSGPLRRGPRLPPIRCR
jgi:glycosyltransferase involved in cell wall biosynthesis